MELEKAKKEVDLLEYIKQAGHQVEKKGNVYRVEPCPICGHKEHFTIYPADNSYSSFSGCCSGGSIIDFFMEVEGMDRAQAISKLKELWQPEGSGGKAQHIRPEGRAAAGRQQGGSSEKEPAEAEKKAALSLIEEAAGNECSYYYNRGLTDKTIKPYKLGYLPGGHEYGKQYKYILPVEGHLYMVRSDQEGDQVKYRNKGKKGLFNRRYLRDSSLTAQHIFITEGIIDALSLEELDRPAVAIDSTTGAGKLIEAVKENREGLREKVFIIALDSDQAGQEVAEKIKQGLEGLDLQAVNFKVEGYKDINQALTMAREALRKQLEGLQVKGTIYEYLLDEFEVDQAKRIEEPDILTGIKSLDKTLGGGLYPGLYILGAISSLGKTALALQVADRIAEQGHQVLFFSLEMARYEMTCRSLTRVLFEQTGNRDITTGHVLRSSYQGEDLYMVEGFKQALEAYREGPAKSLSLVEGDFNITIYSIKSKAKEHQARTGERPVIFIDYLQAIQPEPEGRLTDKQHIDQAVIALKRISRDLDLPVIAISSFNRASYNAEEGPSMVAYKESGAIEYTADVLLSMQLRRGSSEDINELKNREPRPIDLFILKNRRGRAFENIGLEYWPKQNYFKEV